MFIRRRSGVAMVVDVRSCRLPPWFVMLTAGVIACTRTAPSPAIATSTDITAADLQRRLFLIADDSMMGRETGSAGDYKTTDYIASEFKRLGLEPAGDNGSYFQAVPFWRAALDPASRLAVGDQQLTLVRDFVPVSLNASPRVLSGVPVIYAGSAADTAHLISPAEGAGKFVVLDIPRDIPIRIAGPLTARWRDAVAVSGTALEQMPPEAFARMRAGHPVADSTRNPRVVPVLWISLRVAPVMS